MGGTLAYPGAGAFILDLTDPCWPRKTVYPCDPLLTGKDAVG